MARTSPAPDDAQAGFALLVAILFLLLVTSVIAPFVLAARTRFDLSAAASEKARLDILADGLVTVLARELAGAPGAAATLSIPLRSTPAVCRTGRLAIEARLQDQDGLVNLNTAGEPLLEAALRALGLETDAAAANARAIVAYREVPIADVLADAIGSEDLPAPEMGAEAPDPSLVLNGFKGAPFEAIEELYDFPALEGVPLRRLAETFTLYADTDPDPALAPEHLAAFLPAPEPSEDTAPVVPELEPGVFRIDVFVRAEGDATLGYGGAVVALSGDDSGGFAVQERTVNPNILPGAGSRGAALPCAQLFGAPAAAALQAAAS
jgi:hypothetical protein